MMKVFPLESLFLEVSLGPKSAPLEILENHHTNHKVMKFATVIRKSPNIL